MHLLKHPHTLSLTCQQFQFSQMKYFLLDGKSRPKVLHDRLVSNTLEEEPRRSFDDFDVSFNYQDHRWQYYRTFHQ